MKFIKKLPKEKIMVIPQKSDRVYFDMRRSKGYTDELEKFRWVKEKNTDVKEK